jgi:hypothetical protein
MLPSVSVPVLSSTTAVTCIRQHPSAYVSIRQHTSAYVSIRQLPLLAFLSCLALPQSPAYVSIRQHTSASASVSIRQHTLQAFLQRMLTYADGIRQHQHTSAYGKRSCLATSSIRQHPSAYVSIRQHQHTSAYVSYAVSVPV